MREGPHMSVWTTSKDSGWRLWLLLENELTWCFPNWQASHLRLGTWLNAGMADLSLAKEGWPKRKCHWRGDMVALKAEKVEDTNLLVSKEYSPSFSCPEPIIFLVLRSWKAHEVGSNVIKQFKALVNWLTESKLNGESGTKRIDGKDNDLVGWRIPFPRTDREERQLKQYGV